MSLSELQGLVMDREAWHAAIHGVAKSRTPLSDWTELSDIPSNLSALPDPSSSPLHLSSFLLRFSSFTKYSPSSNLFFLFSSSNYPYLTTEISKFKSATPCTLNATPPFPTPRTFLKFPLSWFPSFPWFTLYPLVSPWLISIHPPRCLNSRNVCFSPSWSWVNSHPYHPSKRISRRA